MKKLSNTEAELKNSAAYKQSFLVNNLKMNENWNRHKPQIVAKTDKRESKQNKKLMMT